MKLIDSHPVSFQKRTFEVRVYDRGSDYFVSGYEHDSIKTWSYTVGRVEVAGFPKAAQAKPYAPLIAVVKANIKAGMVLP